MTFSEAYEDLYIVVFRYCNHKVKNHHVAEDITSESFYLLHEKWDTLKSHERAVLLSWLLSTSKYKMYNYYRKEKSLYDAYIDEKYADPHTLLSTNFYNEDLYQKYLVDIQKRLTEKEKNLFAYIIIQEKDFSEIALMLNITEKAVRMRWLRIKLKIKGYINDIINKP